MLLRLREKPSEVKGIPQCETVTAATAIMGCLLRVRPEAITRATSTMAVKMVFLPGEATEQA